MTRLEIFVALVCALGGMYYLAAAILQSTKNAISAVLYQFIPLVLGMLLLLASAMMFTK